MLNGNAVDLGGNVANQSTNTQTINLGLTYSADRTLDGGLSGLNIGGSIGNTANITTLTLAGNGMLTNLLYNADGATNVLNLISNANWTLIDNASSTPIIVAWNLFTAGGTLNFGTASSAPTLTSTTPQGLPHANQLGIASGTATFNMVNDTFTTSARFNTATTSGATGIVNQVGGTFNVSSQFQGCNGTGGTAFENLGGGTMNIGLDVLTNGSGGSFFNASRGVGVLTVSNTATLVCNTLDVSRNIGATIGTVNLNSGGTIAARRVGTATSSANTTQNGSAATFNFNGGTLKARTSSSTYFQGSTASPALPITTIVKSGGAVIDTDTNSISILEPLQHDSALGSTPDGGLTKIGLGTLTLPAANTYTGPTLVNAGTLAVSGSLAAGATVTVNSGGTLGGNRTCGGNVTVNSGGTLAPGGSIGILTVWSNVTFLTGSTNLVEINRGPAPTNDLLRCLSPGVITLGGTLVVTNIGPALQSGDTFTLYSGTLIGSITPVLPPLWPGLSWNTSSLNSLGRISVTGTFIPPGIGISIVGGNVILSGSGGLAGATYYVVTSPNVALPLSSWIPVATNTFDASGNINVGIQINPAVPNNFYRIAVP